MVKILVRPLIESQYTVHYAPAEYLEINEIRHIEIYGRVNGLQEHHGRCLKITDHAGKEYLIFGSVYEKIFDDFMKVINKVQKLDADEAMLALYKDQSGLIIKEEEND